MNAQDQAAVLFIQGRQCRAAPRAPSLAHSCCMGVVALAPTLRMRNGGITAMVIFPVSQPQVCFYPAEGCRNSCRFSTACLARAKPKAAPGCSHTFALPALPPARLEPACSHRPVLLVIGTKKKRCNWADPGGLVSCTNPGLDPAGFKDPHSVTLLHM